MKKFEQDLANLKARINEMGTISGQMVEWASQALVKGDKSLAARVLEAEQQLDRFQIEVDNEAVRLITIYAPTARDLRFLLMVARISTELERIGDQAVNNCEYLQMLLSDPPPRPLDDLTKMTEITCDMMRGALDAFAREDVVTAEHVIGMDDAVDALNRRTFEDLLSDRMEDRDKIRRSMSLILLARSLERIADHTVNICEEVVYLVKGEDIRHQP
jgi:phosphate transport system protein